MKMGVIFKPLHCLSAAYDLWNECKIFVDDYDSIREQGWRTYFEQFPDRFLSAYSTNDDLVAICVLFYDGRKAGVYRLAVSPAVQGKGLGHELINLAEKTAKREGMSGVYALVDRGSKISQALFTKNGFSSIPEVQYFTKSI